MFSEDFFDFLLNFGKSGKQKGRRKLSIGRGRCLYTICNYNVRISRDLRNL